MWVQEMRYTFPLFQTDPYILEPLEAFVQNFQIHTQLPIHIVLGIERHGVVKEVAFCQR
jgi:hypothetical protein